MKPSLLSSLRCPETGDELTLDSAVVGEEVIEGELVSAGGKTYPIVRGVPRFVSNEQYAGNFGFEWNLFNRTQVDEEGDQESGIRNQESGIGDQESGGEELIDYAGLVTRKGHESHDTFYFKTGLKPEELEGKRVLDAGCGTGRFAAIAADAGAEVFACDLSSAVEACYRNLGDRPNVHVVQGDIFKLPLAEESFDFIYSLGVLHHTPDTKKAFLALPRLLKPGGKFCVWVYAHLPWKYGIVPPYYLMSDFLRRWTVHWPSERLLKFSEMRASMHWLVRIPLLGKIADRCWPGSVHPDYEWRVLDTFDWYSPVYQFKHTWEEVKGWYEEAGFEGMTQLEFPVSGYGVKK
jgi:SAM-dependent methyltransferase/uncharacterized protein YbaR (Trm112 family)